jgi:hypothetical protein
MYPQKLLECPCSGQTPRQLPKDSQALACDSMPCQALNRILVASPSSLLCMRPTVLAEVYLGVALGIG